MTRALLFASALVLLFSGAARSADQQPGENEPVIGLTFRGADRAYPLSVFSPRRVVNDVVGQQEVVVFHDPDRGLTAAWFRTVFGDPIEFSGQVTGTVADDLTTITRWDMTTGVAVGGNLAGQKLVPVPIRMIPLSVWRAKYPSGALFFEQGP